MKLENNTSIFLRDIKGLKKILSYNTEEYENAWQIIKKSYNHVYLCRIYVGSVGEFICRYLMIREDLANNINDLYVFVPYIAPKKEVSNRNLLSLISREILIINDSNWDFWKYIIKKHYKELNFKYYKKYDVRRDTYYDLEKDNAILNICNIHNRMGKAVTKKIGVSDNYVCFHSRDEKYNIMTKGSDYTEFIGRNSSFENYSESMEYLHEHQIKAVRMGKYVNPCHSNMKFINFAEKYYCDFMDTFLLANCKFYVGPNSGINMVAKAFARPIVVVNSTSVTVGAGCDINMEENILILKKYYNTRTKKFLSLRTIARYERRFRDDTSQYKKIGITIVDNTSQEILDAVTEMNERLDGIWKETDEDRLLQEKYRNIINELNEENRKRFWNGGATLYRIGCKYLRENQYLLEE